jgi:hypothetical protein
LVLALLQFANRSSGTQIINVTHKNYRWNKITGTWQYVTYPGYSISVPNGYRGVAPGREYQDFSGVEESYFVYIQVTWRTPGGTLIAQRTIRTTSSADFSCVFSRAMCVNGGT